MKITPQLLLSYIFLAWIFAVMFPGWISAAEDYGFRKSINMKTCKQNEVWDELPEQGRRQAYTREALRCIGMPCGGICAGQLYVRGDGTLAYWWIMNNARNTGPWPYIPGELNIETPVGTFPVGYQPFRPPSVVEQGVIVRTVDPDGAVKVRELNQGAFTDIRFYGEYPVATVDYVNESADEWPLAVRAQVYSPFIPINAKDSSLPVTVLQYTLTNTTREPLNVSLASWLQNAVMIEYAGRIRAQCRNRILAGQRLTSVMMDVVEPGNVSAQSRRIKLIADFEDGCLGSWAYDGKGDKPKPVTQFSSGSRGGGSWQGKWFVNTFREEQGAMEGRLISPPFKIEEPYIAFLLGGSNLPGKCCLNLIVENVVVCTATGTNNERLEPCWLDVAAWIGQSARIEIVDTSQGYLDHISVDYIYQTNLPPDFLDAIPPRHPQQGDMALSVLGNNGIAQAAWTSKAAFLKTFRADGIITSPDRQQQQCFNVGEKRCAVVGTNCSLSPGQSETVTLLVTWYFPNRRQDNAKPPVGYLCGDEHARWVGNMYGNWFRDSVNVAEYVKENFARLRQDTFAFRDALYFETTLPYWLVQRLMAPTSVLATETCQWWQNGRFWAWEGVGCCEGTCTHVWNYAHALARLFPELERTVRERQDFDAGFDPKTGMVQYRGEGFRREATDGQAGTILKAYREHLMSSDDQLLRRNWRRIRQATEYLIRKDGDENGMIEGDQHMTYDSIMFRANPFVGSLYLGALRAAEEMALRIDDTEFAQRCHRIYLSGAKLTEQWMYNGEFFTESREQEGSQTLPARVGDGCLSDQLFGQGWAHQVQLGYLYPRDMVRSALRAVYRHNWLADVTGFYEKLSGEGINSRPFAHAGQAGLVLCSWPGEEADIKNPVNYVNEIWTGVEYQVASHMLYEGMTDEALTILKGVHNRYNGVMQNPWNEVESGDHYARGMAAWGCILGISGFLYDGPAGRIGFAPQIQQDDFRCVFTSAQGWGMLSQQRHHGKQTNNISLRWGSLWIKEMELEVPKVDKELFVTVKSDGNDIGHEITLDRQRILITLRRPCVLPGGATLVITME